MSFINDMNLEVNLASKAAYLRLAHVLNFHGFASRTPPAKVTHPGLNGRSQKLKKPDAVYSGEPKST